MMLRGTVRKAPEGWFLASIRRIFAKMTRAESLGVAFVVPFLFAFLLTRFCRRLRHRFFKTPNARLVRSRSRTAHENIVDNGFVWVRRNKGTLEGSSYTLGSLLVDGNYGQVYECSDSQTSDSMVVKVVAKAEHPLLQPPQRSSRAPRRSATTQATLVEEFRRYFLRVMNLQHPNIVRHLALLTDGDTIYMVMERCAGVPLVEHMLSRSFWKEAHVRFLAKQLLEALSYIHSKSIVHRDVTVDNLMVEAEGRLRLLDFSFGSEASSAAGQLGTLGYMAPEIFQLRYYGCGVDVFAAGVVIFILMTGRPPFKAPINTWSLGDHRQALLLGPDFTEQPLPSVSQGGREVVQGLLHPSPEERLMADEALTHHWFSIRPWNRQVSGGQPVLWMTGDSELRFLQVMGVWSGGPAPPSPSSQIGSPESGYVATMKTIEEQAVSPGGTVTSEQDGSPGARRRLEELLDGPLPSECWPQWTRFVTPREEAALASVGGGFCWNLVKGMSIPVAVADPTLYDSPLITVSAGFEALTGWSARELIGSNCRILNQGLEVSPETRAKMQIAALGKGTFVGVVPNKRKDGSRFHNLLHMAPFEVLQKIFVIGVQMELPNEELASLQSITGEDQAGFEEALASGHEIVGTARRVHSTIRLWMHHTGLLEDSMPATRLRNALLAVEEAHD